MDFALSQEQELIKKSAREFLSKECPSDLLRDLEEDEKGFSPKLWKKMSQVGWMGLIIPFEYGGSDGNFLDLAVLMEEMGRACAPSWFFSTIVLGARIILHIGTENQKKDLLPDMCDGKLIVTLAMIEPDSGYDPAKIEMTSSTGNNDIILDGIKLFVPDAHIADKMICVTKGNEDKSKDKTLLLYIIDLNSPGISITPLQSISGEKLFEVKFDNVKVKADSILGGTEFRASEFKKILQGAALAKCAEMVGGAQKVMDMSVEYSKMREQFGRPIGSFQAIWHFCADMLTELDCSRFITYSAAWMLSESIPCEKETAMAKAFTSEAYIKITSLGQQIHGGTGLIDEHDMQLYFRRAKASALTLGNTVWQLDIVAGKMGL